MRNAKSLLLGTRNPGKIYEIKLILGDLSSATQGNTFEFTSLNEFPHVAVAEENEDTYAGNAIAKARFYAHATGLPALADLRSKRSAARRVLFPLATRVTTRLMATVASCCSRNSLKRETTIAGRALYARSR